MSLERIDTGLLYPPFLLHVQAVIADCEEVGALYVATCGYRSFTEQQKLYFQGRTQAGAIVTQAQAGQSAHNFGLAVDLCRMLPENSHTVVSWEPQDYDALGEACEREGLVWGGRFNHPDRPHIQWPGFVTTDELRPLKLLVQQSIQTDEAWRPLVWSYVTANSPTIPDPLPKGAA